MYLLEPRDSDKQIRVDENLARAMEMFSTSTTPAGLVRYMQDQVYFPWPIYEPPAPVAIAFLVELAHTLTLRALTRSLEKLEGIAA